MLVSLRIYENNDFPKLAKFFSKKFFNSLYDNLYI